jgi:uncharacterized membrane protein YccF (DUF307 family)
MQMTYSPPVAQPAMVQNATTNVNINYAVSMPTSLTSANHGNLVVRAIWFVLLGWWLGLLWTIFAWLFNLTLIGLPVGLMMLNAIPKITTLHHQSRPYHYPRPVGPQQPLALRAIWFLLIGWWASLVWSIIAWAFSLTLVLMPISFWMWNRVPTITTLAAEQ